MCHSYKYISKAICYIKPNTYGLGIFVKLSNSHSYSPTVLTLECGQQKTNHTN